MQLTGTTIITYALFRMLAVSSIRAYPAVPELQSLPINGIIFDSLGLEERNGLSPRCVPCGKWPRHVCLWSRLIWQVTNVAPTMSNVVKQPASRILRRVVGPELSARSVRSVAMVWNAAFLARRAVVGMDSCAVQLKPAASIRIAVQTVDSVVVVGAALTDPDESKMVLALVIDVVLGASKVPR
jgi:hypothetical protein